MDYSIQVSMFPVTLCCKTLYPTSSPACVCVCFCVVEEQDMDDVESPTIIFKFA